MSEKIVQLNEDVIKCQIKELVRGSVPSPESAHGNSNLHPGKEADPGCHEGRHGLLLPAQKGGGPGHWAAVCHRGSVPGGQCLPGVSHHQAHLSQDHRHELLPVRSVLLSGGAGHAPAGSRHRLGVCPKGLARLRSAGGHSL